MAVFELPLDQLRSYEGRNPRPDDFDDYWARGLDEVSGTAPQIELSPHFEPCALRRVFRPLVTGVGGARIHAQYMRPRGNGPHPAISPSTDTGATRATGSRSCRGLPKDSPWRPWMCVARPACPGTWAACRAGR